MGVLPLQEVVGDVLEVQEVIGLFYENHNHNQVTFSFLI